MAPEVSTDELRAPCPMTLLSLPLSSTHLVTKLIASFRARLLPLILLRCNTDEGYLSTPRPKTFGLPPDGLRRPPFLLAILLSSADLRPPLTAHML